MQQPAIFLLATIVCILQQQGAAHNLKRIDTLEIMIENLETVMVDVQLNIRTLQNKIEQLTLQVPTLAEESDGLLKGGSSHGELEKLGLKNERLMIDVRRLTKGIQEEKKLRRRHERDAHQLVSKVQSLSARLDETNVSVSQLEDTNTSLWKIVNHENVRSLVGKGETTSDNFTSRINSLEMSVCLLHTPCSPWSDWGECSTGCGTGTQTRIRTCDAEQPLPFCCDGLTDEAEEISCKSTSNCCPSSYDMVNDQYCFKSKMTRRTYNWNQSSVFCKSQGGNLPLLDTEEKQASLGSYLRYNSLVTVIPIEGQRVAGAWVNRLGTSLQYFNWRVGDPRPEKHCISMETFRDKWRSRHCTKYSFFVIVCEHNISSF